MAKKKNPFDAITKAGNVSVGVAGQGTAASSPNPIDQVASVGTSAATGGSIATTGAAPASPIGTATQTATGVATRAVPATVGLPAVTRQALGLDTNESLLVPDVLDAAKKYGIQPSLLMGLMENQSGLKPDARIGEERGLGMFGPESRRRYNVEEGTTPRAVKSQINGLAEMLRDAEVDKDPEAAINMWARGNHRNFARRVQETAQHYKPLDQIASAQQTGERAVRQTRPQGVFGQVLSQQREQAQGQRAGQAAARAAQLGTQATQQLQGGPQNTEQLANSRRMERGPQFDLPRMGQQQAAQQRAIPGNPRRLARRLTKAASAAPRVVKQFADLGPAAEQLAKGAIEGGKEFGIDPSFLMAIAEVETGFGAAAGSGTPGAGAISSAGAKGYMQFIPSSRDAVLKATGYDAYSEDPVEAMKAAAGYFSVFAPDAKNNWDRAFSYNHADWYADDVTSKQAQYKALDQASSKSVPRQLIARANNVLGEKATKAILNGGELVKAPKGNEPSKADQRWGGAVGAIHAVVPREYWFAMRGDKRTPSENVAVGGSSTSDHLTTNANAFGADFSIPSDVTEEQGWEIAEAVAKNLGLPQSTGVQSVEKDGVRYQLIWQAEGHYDHPHVGAVVTDPSKAPTAGTQGVKVKGTNLMVVEPVVVSADGTTTAAPSVGGTASASTASSTLAGAVQAAEGGGNKNRMMAPTSIIPSGLADMARSQATWTPRSFNSDGTFTDAAAEEPASDGSLTALLEGAGPKPRKRVRTR